LALILLLVSRESAGLPQHRINQGGLSMVNVGDDRNVTDIVAGLYRQVFEVLLSLWHVSTNFRK
jgi:hypothetical protein